MPILTRETDKGKLYFNDANHRFWKEEEGKKKYLKSVTSFTGILDKPGLPFWAVRLMRDDLFTKLQLGKILDKADIYYAHKLHQIRKQEAADIGTQIHEWIDKWISGENPEIPDHKNVAQGIISFLEFQRENNIEWLEGEFITWSEQYWYAGKPDRKAKFNGLKYIVDFKSSKEVNAEYAFQTALYQIAEQEQTGEEFGGRLILRFAKLSEEDYYEELALENELRKEFGDKPKELKPYRVFEPVFFTNPKDLEISLQLVNVANRLNQLQAEMKGGENNGSEI